MFVLGQKMEARHDEKEDEENTTQDFITAGDAEQIIKTTRELVELLKQQAFWLSHTPSVTYLFRPEERANLKKT